MTANDEVTARVLEELERRGWSRADFARECHLSPSWVTRRLGGDRRWTVDDLDVLARVLGLRLALVHEEEAGVECEDSTPASGTLGVVA